MAGLPSQFKEKKPKGAKRDLGYKEYLEEVNSIGGLEANHCWTTRGVPHYGLAIYILKYLKAKEEL
jgi:hypothetical protein